MKKRRIDNRLTLGGCCLFALLVIAIAIGKFATLSSGNTSMAQASLPKFELAHTLLDRVDAIGIAARNMTLASNEDARKHQLQMIIDSRKAADAVLREMEAVHNSKEGRAFVAQIVAHRTRYLAGQDMQIALMQAGQDEDAKAFEAKEVRPMLAAFKAALTALIADENARIAESAKKAEQVYVDSRNQMLGLGTLAIVMALVIGYMTTNRLFRQLGGEPDHAAEIAAKMAMTRRPLLVLNDNHPKERDTA